MRAALACCWAATSWDSNGSSQLRPPSTSSPRNSSYTGCMLKKRAALKHRRGLHVDAEVACVARGPHQGRSCDRRAQVVTCRPRRLRVRPPSGSRARLPDDVSVERRLARKTVGVRLSRQPIRRHHYLYLRGRGPGGMTPTSRSRRRCSPRLGRREDLMAQSARSTSTPVAGPSDAESIDPSLEKPMWLRRADSIGHRRQLLHLLGYALTWTLCVGATAHSHRARRF